MNYKLTPIFIDLSDEVTNVVGFTYINNRSNVAFNQ